VHRYLREPERLVFPTFEEMPETRRHLEIRTALYQSLKAAFRELAVLGSEQFVFWDPTDPRARCAPDVMVRLGERDAPFDSWKIWERGAPHLAVEIISASDSTDKPWQAKLERYRKVGLRELVSFDPDDVDRPLRIWDFLDGDLVERDPLAPDFRASAVLGAHWVIKEEPDIGSTLRLARDPLGADLFLTFEEAHRIAEEAKAAAEEAKAAAEEAKAAAEEGKAAAEHRVRELEVELARRRE
jgi:Uma2 family endonuclease